VGLEMLRAVPELDTLVIAVGGGGLIGGIATTAKALKPDIKILGVQAERFPAMVNAVKGTQQPQGASTIAEGIAVGRPGLLPLETIRSQVDDMLLVDAGDIEQAIVLLLEIEKNPSRRRRRGGSGRRAQVSRIVQGAESRPGAVRRQYRSAAVVLHHRARHGALWAVGAHPRGRAQVAQVLEALKAQGFEVQAV
jgi:Pyridoxal-phosphate dependent enzyme